MDRVKLLAPRNTHKQGQGQNQGQVAAGAGGDPEVLGSKLHLVDLAGSERM